MKIREKKKFIKLWWAHKYEIKGGKLLEKVPSWYVGLTKNSAFAVRTNFIKFFSGG